MTHGPWSVVRGPWSHGSIVRYIVQRNKYFYVLTVYYHYIFLGRHHYSSLVLRYYYYNILLTYYYGKPSSHVFGATRYRPKTKTTTCLLVFVSKTYTYRIIVYEYCTYLRVACNIMSFIVYHKKQKKLYSIICRMIIDFVCN